MLPASIERDEWLDGVQGSRLSGPVAANDWQQWTCVACAPARAHEKVGGLQTLFGVARRSPGREFAISRASRRTLAAARDLDHARMPILITAAESAADYIRLCQGFFPVKETGDGRYNRPVAERRGWTVPVVDADRVRRDGDRVRRDRHVDPPSRGAEAGPPQARQSQAFERSAAARGARAGFGGRPPRLLALRPGRACGSDLPGDGAADR